MPAKGGGGSGTWTTVNSECEKRTFVVSVVFRVDVEVPTRRNLALYPPRGGLQDDATEKEHKSHTKA